jgi:hypothetical protein
MNTAVKIARVCMYDAFVSGDRRLGWVLLCCGGAAVLARFQEISLASEPQSDNAAE